MKMIFETEEPEVDQIVLGRPSSMPSKNPGVWGNAPIENKKSADKNLFY